MGKRRSSKLSRPTRRRRILQRKQATRTLALVNRRVQKRVTARQRWQGHERRVLARREKRSRKAGASREGGSQLLDLLIVPGDASPGLDLLNLVRGTVHHPLVVTGLGESIGPGLGIVSEKRRDPGRDRGLDRTRSGEGFHGLTREERGDLVRIPGEEGGVRRM